MGMDKKLMLIVNPSAGKGGYKSHLGEILNILSQEYLPTVYFTQREGDAARYARQHGSQYDLVVCCGGDGTLSETMSGLVQTENNPVLGYIPMGTANDMAATLNLPKNPVQAAKTILQGRIESIDMGKFGEEYFCYIAAFGAFTQVSYQTPVENKRALGHLAYVIEGLLSLPKIVSHHVTVKYDNRWVEGEYVFGSVTNSLSVAGLVKLDPALVELGDGLFEVILVRNPNNLIELRRILHDILTQTYDPEYVTVFHSRKITFTFEQPVAWTRDGEAGGDHREITLSNLKGAIKMILPQEKQAKQE